MISKINNTKKFKRKYCLTFSCICCEKILLFSQIYHQPPAPLQQTREAFINLHLRSQAEIEMIQLGRKKLLSTKMNKIFCRRNLDYLLSSFLKVWREGSFWDVSLSNSWLSGHDFGVEEIEFQTLLSQP